MSNFTQSLSPDYEITGLDGTIWKLSPITFKQFGEYCLWWQFKEYSDAKKIGINDKDLLKEIYNLCKNKQVDFGSLEVFRSMTTPEGISKLTLLALKKNYPNVTEEQVGDILNPLNFDEVGEQILRQTGLLPDTENTEDKKEESGE